MNLTEKLQLAYQKIKNARRLLIIGHVSPDADALASIGAMLEAARRLDVPASAFAGQKSAGTYDFIPNEDKILVSAPKDFSFFDVILIMDCGAISRTGVEDELRTILDNRLKNPAARRSYLIEFDHHETQESYADLEIKLTDKASTTEIVYNFFKANNLLISKKVADCILIGLMTDTGNFLHANSSREVLAVSSEMLLLGASLPKILDNTARNKSFKALKVWGRALDNIKFNSETGLASSVLTAVELQELLPPSEEVPGDLFGDIVSFLSQLAGVRVALFLREENGRVKGSLRTHYDNVDVAAIARKFGGGGHKKAAGFSIEGKLQATDTGWRVVKM